MAVYVKGGSFIALTDAVNVYAHEINTLPGFARIISSIDGIEKYDRILAVAREEDVVILKSTPDQDYLEWLAEVGFGRRKTIVLESVCNDVLPERIIKRMIKDRLRKMLAEADGDTCFCPYYGGALEEEASYYLQIPMYSCRDLVKKYDSKIRFKEICRELGVPVMDDEVFTAAEGTNELLRRIKKLLQKSAGVIVRGEFGASASSTYLFQAPDEMLAQSILTCADPGERYLIEPYVKKLSSPSTNWFIKKNGAIVHLRTSNQILENGLVHAGNEFPLAGGEAEVNGLSLKIAGKFAAEGFIGPFGIDFMESETGFLATECNPRVTGAMYPWEIVRSLEEKHGNIPAARSENIRLAGKGITFSGLRAMIGDFFYNGSRMSECIVPFNIGPLGEGKFAMLVLGACSADVQRLSVKVKARLQQCELQNQSRN